MLKVNGGLECFIYLLVGLGTWEREYGMLNRQLGTHLLSGAVDYYLHGPCSL